MRLPIKTKRDWAILFIIVFIALYYISMYYNSEIEKFMMRYAPDKMNIMNYPEGWGNLALVGLIMTLLITLILILQKVSIKRILVLVCVGVVFSIIMFCGYFIHTGLIVGTGRTLTADRISITNYNGTDVNLSEETSLGKKFTDLAVSLKAKPESEQRVLRAKLTDHAEESWHVWISYPKKYGQSYDLILYINSDGIYSNHGMGDAESRIFFNDNGFYESLQSLVKEYGTQS